MFFFPLQRRWGCAGRHELCYLSCTTQRTRIISSYCETSHRNGRASSVKLERSYEVERKGTHVTITCPTCDRLFLFVGSGGNCEKHSRSFHRGIYIYICVCVNNIYMYKRGEENQLDAPECFIKLMICSTCFGHLYAHHQELETILMLLPHMVCNALVAGGRLLGAE